MIYDGEPHVVGTFKADVVEFFRYLYLPIKLSGDSELTLEPRLKPVSKIVGAACCDFIGEHGLDRFVSSYVYVTAKNAYQPLGTKYNRPGWHSDGFGTDDISYIWSDRQPTVFNVGPFDLSDDDVHSMIQMEEQASPVNETRYSNNTLLRLDQTVIHRVGEAEEGVRCFVKVVVSADQFRLRGNSINYGLNYHWKYEPRRNARNVPQGSVAESAQG